MVVVLLALPLLWVMVGQGGGFQRDAKAAPADESGVPLSDGFMSMLLVFGLVRSLNTFANTVSAGVQRRHLYVWALFAPKFVFEVCFLGVTDTLLIMLFAFWNF
jgi:hypothetical protein